jgi:hypothetical protein
LPAAGRADFENYCRSVIAADSKPSPVEKLLNGTRGRREGGGLSQSKRIVIGLVLGVA